MTTILSEIGKRLLDQWATLLVVPGLLFVATAVAGFHLGQADALDVQALAAWITAELATGRSPDIGAVLLAVAAASLAAAAVGLCVAVVGRVTAYVWTIPGRLAPLRWFVRRRQMRWERADARVAAAIGAAIGRVDRGGIGAAIAARERIGLVKPTHPTWIGDRLTAPAARISARYGLDLAAAWPRLWLIVPDAARTELTAAHAAYMAAARLVGWAVVYTLLAVVWWPSAIIAVVLAVTARVQSHAVVVTLADLTEATVDLFGVELAARLNIVHTGELNPETGFAVTSLLRKDQVPVPAQPESLTGRVTNRGDY